MFERVRLYSVLLGLLGPGVIAAPDRREVYVDVRQGNDQTGTGSMKSPWKSVRYAATRMNSGEVCILREGVYRETIVPKDGQEFRAFGKETVVITGCDVVGNWKVGEDGISTAPVVRPVSQVFLDGERMHKARYPDEDGDMSNTADWAETVAERGRPSRNGSAEVVFTAGLGGKSFEGGFFSGLNGRNPYQANMGRIVRTEGDRLFCEETNLRWHRSRPGEFEGKGRGYITDHMDALTSPKEWHWEKGALHLIPPQGKTLAEKSVEARVRLYGFDCSNRKRVSIKGLVFRAASVLMDGSEGCLIADCTLTDVSPWGRFFDRRPHGDPEHYTYGNPEDGTAGIYIAGSRNTIRRCRVSRGWGALITVRGSENTVENNIVEEANWQCREFAVNIVVNGSNHRIARNTVRGSTAMLIVMIDIDRVPTVAPVISRNDCRDYGRIMLDGGTAAIYFNGNDDMGGGEISHNFIADNRTVNQRVSCGIYLDDGANNVRVHHNVVDGGGLNRCGLFTHRGNKRMAVFHNTFWGHRDGGWVSAVWEGTRDSSTMVYRNNLSGGKGFVAKGVPGLITLDHNRNDVPASEFADVLALDFTLAPGSASIDAGAPAEDMAGVRDGKPDVGAFERGAPWSAGVDWIEKK